MGNGKQDKNFANKDIFSRISYLYQAAHITLQQNPDNIGLVRFYASQLKIIARKSVLRLDPSIKRTLCKKCYMLLHPGITASYRTRGKTMIVTCLECHTVKRFPAKAGYKLRCEKAEAWKGDFPLEEKSLHSQKTAQKTAQK